jgi:hypothetical protein
MSPPKNFEDEVFISYAHIDNQPLDEGLKGWVETLHERLQIRLGQLTGEPVSIWRDRKLQGNDIFADTLITRLSKVALLVTVISPRYVKSEWCLRELEEFCKSASAGGGLIVGDKARVFKVVKIHIPLESHPPQLRGVLGYEFFEYDAERGRAKEFNPEVVPQRDIRYWEKLDDLAYDIKQLIETMRDTRGASSGASSSGAVPAIETGDGKTVYLAETVFDLRQERELIKRELQQHGHVVLPEVELPLSGATLAETVRDCLRRSDLSVHLIGGNYGIIPEEESRSLVEIQCELAGEADETLRRIVWMPVGLEPRDERQRQFINHFQSGLNGHRRIEVLQTSLEDLKKLIEERISVQAAPTHDPSTGEGGDRPASVYLICDKEDLDEVSPLEEYLYETGLDVILPAFEGDEAAVREDHKANLLECDAVMLYFGRGSEIWLRMKQRELQKIAGYGRSKPMLAKAIYLAAPHTPAKEHVRDRESIIIKNFAAFSPDCLAPFVERVRQTKGGRR